MGNAESSTNGGKLEEKEEEERAKLARMLKAGAIAAAGLATVAAAGVAASRYLQSSPPPSYSLEERKGLVLELLSSSQSLELDGDFHHHPPQTYGLRDKLPEMYPWHSIYTDFSAPRGIGYVISDDDGNVVLAGAKSLSFDSNNCTQGEAMAVHFALQRASELKHEKMIIIRKVKLKSDSESLVNCINGHATPGPKMKTSIQSIAEATKNFQDYKALHVSRNRIQAANFLARYARNHDDEWYLGTSSSGHPAPCELTEFLRADGLQWRNA